jgi:hypothetical protein
MATVTAKPVFSGPFRNLLGELAQLIDRLMEEHGTSFVKAGDDQVYALGGNGYNVVFDQNRWQGQVEIFTPTATLSVKPDQGGTPVVNAGTLDEKATKQALRESIDHLASYYENRYWITP